MPITLNGDTGITTPMYNGSITANVVTPSVNMKNRIINGAVTISQRNGSSATTIPAYTNTYGPDRWYGASQPVGSKYSIAQGNTGGAALAAGFVNCLNVVSLSAYSITSGDIHTVCQRIEGYNTADLQWGTANAKTVTLSFWAYSSITGTWAGVITDSANAYTYPFTYTISSASTWEYKTITIAGPTSGTWSTTTGIGLNLCFSVGVGSSFTATANAWTSAANTFGVTGANSLLGTNGAQLSFTGVQLEVGSSATSFDYVNYQTSFANCLRYYWKFVGQNASGNTQIGSGMQYNGGDVRCTLQYPVPMRIVPSVTFGGSGFGFERPALSFGTIGSAFSANQTFTTSLLYSSGSTTAGMSNGYGTMWGFTDNTSFIAVSAEL